MGIFLTTGAPFLAANEKSTNSGQTKSFFSVFLKKPDSSDDWLNCVKPSNATCADCADKMRSCLLDVTIVTQEIVRVDNFGLWLAARPWQNNSLTRSFQRLIAQNWVIAQD